VEQFEIDGCKFWFKRVSLEDGCKGLRLVSEIVGPALSAGDMAQALTASIDKLPQLVTLFAKYTDFQADHAAAGRKVALAKFTDDLFRGRLDLAVLFVANCAVIEYGDFLGERLQRLGDGMADLVNRFPALKALIHSSGDSSSADTSKTD
jgi:uncharacterized membrane protein YgcG